MRHVFKFRLYPTEEQEKQMLEWVETCRRLWNSALENRQTQWKQQKLTVTYAQQSKLLTEMRRDNPYMNQLYSQVGQDILRRLDKAYKAFFKGISKYPKFKKFSNEGSFTYPQAYHHNQIRLYKKMIKLPKIGFVSAVIHRGIPSDSMIKTCTVRCLRDGTWCVILVCEDEQMIPPQPKVFVSPVGIDLGLKSVITTSDGVKAEPLKALRKSEKRLSRLQRHLDRKMKGSKNRAKARLRVARIHSKIAHQREDFNHKLSMNLVRQHDLIIFEDLKIETMVKNHKLAKSIQDAGWYQLKIFVKYKELKAGGSMIEVPAAYTTRDCSYCGTRNKVSLDMREFVCVGCWRLLDRDINSARNVLKEGLLKVGQGMPELKPVEKTAPPIQLGVGSVPDLHEAGTYPSNEPHVNH